MYTAPSPVTQKSYPLNLRKGVLQSAATLFAGVSFILAIACGVLLYVRVDEVGGHNPIAASLMASIFFFVCVGVVLAIIGRSNLPTFKIDSK